MSRILVIGGYGGFGARLSRRLLAAGHQVLVAGRSKAKAEEFCKGRSGAIPVNLNRSAPLSSALKAMQPELVIDAAGPFQASGYDVPTACILHGCSYLDLADATEFVVGIGRLDGPARLAGVSVISGVSSVPALSGAVTHRLAEGLDHVSQVEIALSATTRSTATKSVVGAILSYAGKPIRLSRAGRWTQGFGGSDLRRTCFRVEGAKSLRRRWVALCDVPDLALLPDMLPGCPAVTFRAGSDRAPQILGLWLASWLVRVGFLRSLSGFRDLFLRFQKLTMWSNSRRSAMEITLLGWKGEERVERRWTLLAEDESGPEIPTLAAALLADRFARGRIASGARDASRELRLDDFDEAFRELPLRWEIAERTLDPTLYRRIMGDSFDRLPKAVREMHKVNGDAGAFGEGIVSVGNGWTVGVLRRLMRLPPAGSYPLHVSFSERVGVETWERSFGRHRFRSSLSQNGRRIVERFGPIAFHFDLATDPSGLLMDLRGWTLFGVPMSLTLAPRIFARESEHVGRFHFEVEASLPWLGMIVSYRGWLIPARASATNTTTVAPLPEGIGLPLHSAPLGSSDEAFRRAAGQFRV